MARSRSKTQTGSLQATWSRVLEGDGRDQDGREVEPRLRILYHVDIARIGAICEDDTLASGAWHTVGRHAPDFTLVRGDSTGQPIEDPAISRKQFRVRWSPHEGSFEVEPVAQAKRRLGVVPISDASPPDADQEAHAGSRRIVEVSGRVRLEPGSCIAVEDRLIVGLEAVRAPDPDDPQARDTLGLVGESAAMWNMRDQIREVARFGKPALVIGPTGAGKELVAAAIHRCSARSEHPFITVNCAALPEQLVESLLFGHQRGAFTGANADRLGMFRAADKGTLFLDELGEMPLAMQPKLLRTIQDGIVVPVGQYHGVAVDVRLIAATNRDLEQAVRTQHIREDLYHRLTGHIVRVPPLGARRFDVPALFMHFLTGLRAEHPELAWLWSGPARWKRTIPQRFVLELLRNPWSGNVRELQNIAERCARSNLHQGSFKAPLSSSDTPRPTVSRPIEPVVPARAPLEPAARDETPLAARERLTQASTLLALAHKTVAKLLDDATLTAIWDDSPDNGDDQAALGSRLEARAADRLFELLEEHGFKQRPLAETLGVSPSTLIKLMSRFGLPRPADLEPDVIERALDAADQDVARAARSLRVSAQGLKKRLTALDQENRS